MNETLREELDAALGRFVDGEPEPCDDEMLAAAMAGDPEFAEEVRGLLMLDDLLRQNASSDDRAFIESLKIELGAEREGKEFVQNLSHHLRLAQAQPPTRRRLFHRLTAAAVFVLLPLTGAIVGHQWWAREAIKPPAPPISSRAVHGSQPQGTPTVAVLTRVVNAQWEAASGSTDEGSALSPGHIRLAAGLVQIEFISGASVIVEGPCDVELLSPKKAICHRGKLRTHVPPAAYGFTIAAAGAEAVDLGTEFALRVDERGHGEIHVLDGAVELHGPGEPPANQIVTTLIAGRGAGFGIGEKTHEIQADSTGFVDRSKLLDLEDVHHRQRYERWLAHSRALRADPAMVLYYSFQENNTWERTLRNVAGTRVDDSLDGAIVGCLWCAGRWRDKSALEFKRTSDRVRINVPGEFDQLSLAAWVRIEGLNTWLSALVLTDNWDSRSVHWQLNANGEIILGVCFDGGLDGGRHSPPVLGPKYLGRWVHLVCTYDKRTNVLVHYLDGSPIAERSLRAPTTLRIGLANIGNWDTYGATDYNEPLRSLNGRIDEFAIFRRILSSDEIKQMYELGKPNS